MKMTYDANKNKKPMTTIQESIHQHWCDHTTDYNIVFQNIMSFDDQMAAVSIIGKEDIDNYNTVSLNNTMWYRNIDDFVPTSSFSDFLDNIRFSILFG